MKPLTRFQKTIILLYVFFVLWVSVFDVPWVVRPGREASFQSRERAPIFIHPEASTFRDRVFEVGYAYIDVQQIAVLLFAGTVVAGGLFLLSANAKKKEKKKKPKWFEMEMKEQKRG